MANTETSDVRSSSVAAGASALVLLAIAGLTLGIARQPWGERAWAVAALLSCIALLHGITSTLLALRVSANRGELPLAWFSGGYAFTAILVVFQLLSIPGVVAPHSAAPQVDQTSAWLWLSWHAGLPVFVLLAMRALIAQRETEAHGGARAVLAPVLTGIGAALALALLTHATDTRLPVLVGSDNDYGALVHSAMGDVVVALNVVALAGVVAVTRLRGIAYQWLALALLAFNLDIWLSFAGSVRFTAGWYMARLMSVLASASLLVALLVDHFQLLRATHDRAEALDDLAHRDSLTGLFNRRYFETHLTHEFQRAKRYGHVISVLLIDLDHFKSINDRLGHLRGDDCLKAFAQALAGRIKRAGEFAARYGGEEFAVVLPETANPAAQALAEDVRREVEALYALGRAPSPITVSIGVATSNPRAIERSFNELLSAADFCLYEAKHNGRNRVVGVEVGADAMRPPPLQAAT